MEHLFYDPHFWVAVAFFLLIALIYKKVATMMAAKLDNRSEKIRAELEEASRLRSEAEQLLAVYQQKQAQYLKEAEEMLLNARKDADIISEHAQQELKLALEERQKHAVEKIAREEEKALQDVRNHIVDIALAAARSVISAQAAKLSQKELVKSAISDMERKIH